MSTVPAFNTGESSTAMRWDERRQGCLRLGNEVLPGRFRWALKCELTGVAEERKLHVPQCVGSIGIGLVAGGTTNIANRHLV